MNRNDNPTIIVILLVMGFCLAPITTSAASISIVPDDQDGRQGQQISVDLVGNFNDQATLGGGFDISFDDSVLEFVSFTHSSLGSPDFQRNPDESAGLLSGIAFGDFDGIGGQGVIGTLIFRVLPMGSAGATLVDVSENSGAAGPFVSGVAPYQQQSVIFNSGQINVIPVLLYDGFEGF